MSSLTPTTTSSSLPPLPIEILEQIVTLSADSGGPTVSLKLCVVNTLFYQSAIKRIYHTVSVKSAQQLEHILQTSALLKPWVAACVRVLTFPPYSCPTFPEAWFAQTLSTFTGLMALLLPTTAVFDALSPPPQLRRLVQIESKPLPLCIAQNLTHLCLYKPSVQFFLQMLKLESAFKCLTHLLVVNSQKIMDALDVLKLPHGLPRALRVFVVFIGNFNDLDYLSQTKRIETAQQVLDANPGIVLWASGSIKSPNSWTSTQVLLYSIQSYGLSPECLEALPDGVEGIWEVAEQWLLKIGQK
ncbi:hypothetical protein DL96DRAFT_1811827 [Flagelloscypha sp. PMI_526]|nr:hypothetical protein DL96DRAFT_1811827 [Flagelloscypha sp. PMI_526]